MGVLGPVLGPDYSVSILLVQRLMEGTLSGCLRLCFGIVDVRDVAELHIRAMTHPAAKGERFLVVAGDFMSILDAARILKRRMGGLAKRVPTLQMPNWLIRLAALRDPAVRQILPELGKVKNATNEKAKRMLGWTPRSNEESIIATAESLVRLGLLKVRPKKLQPDDLEADERFHRGPSPYWSIVRDPWLRGGNRYSWQQCPGLPAGPRDIIWSRARLPEWTSGLNSWTELD